MTYGLYPLDQRFRAALPEYGLPDPPYPDGRNPSLKDVRQVLDHLPGFRAEYEPPPTRPRSWGVTIEDAMHPEDGPWAHLRTLRYRPEDQSTDFYFEKGWPDLIVRIVAQLASLCGTLCIVPDTGEAPLIVPAGVDPDHLLNAWEHTRPASGDKFEEEP